MFGLLDRGYLSTGSTARISALSSGAAAGAVSVQNGFRTSRRLTLNVGLLVDFLAHGPNATTA